MEGRESLLWEMAAVQHTAAALSYRVRDVEGLARELLAVHRLTGELTQQINRGLEGTEAFAVGLAIDGVSQRLRGFQHQLSRMDEQALRWRSERHRVPYLWESPVALADEYLRYSSHFPHMPPRPCFYHSDMLCEGLRDVPQGYVYPASDGWEWFATRNHVWRPCRLCLARGNREAG